MRGLKALILVSILVLGGFSLIPLRASAQGGAPDWTVGDFWSLQNTGDVDGTSVTLKIKIEVLEETILAVNGVYYETYRCSTNISVIIYPVMLRLQGETHFLRSTLGVVMRRHYNDTEQAVSTYNPPLEELRFPLADGKQWSSSTTITSMMNSTTTVESITADYTVYGPRSVIVSAGRFNVFGVDAWQRSPSVNSSTNYYSDEVGFMVSSAGSYLGFTQPLPLHLTSYKYQKPLQTTYMFILASISIIVAAVVTFLIVRRSRDKRIFKPKEDPGQECGISPIKPPNN